MKKNIANIVTFTRILGTCAMWLTEVLSLPFYIAYIYSGLSDVIDGFLARKLHIESDFGRKLDSISDLFFYTTMMIKIWPYLVKYLPQEVWILIWITLGIRIALYLVVSLGQKKLLSNHTYLNKATGASMFLLPFFVEVDFFVPYSEMVLALAIIAALYEIVLVIKRKCVK